MKILVSAYACDPYGGSEPGVGWTAVCRIARHHDVFVLTDIHNKAGWDKGAIEGVIPPNIKVRFLRDRSACSNNRFIAHIQSWQNYASFNRKVLVAAMQWHGEEQFDLCHQVTIAAWRMPSPLWRMPVPFVWGPVGGAGHIPSCFRGMLGPGARLFEFARDIQTALACRSSAFQECIRETSVVFAANEETEMFLRPFRGDKPLIRLPIASLPADKVERFRPAPRETPLDGPLRLFAGGNMEGRKGVSIALRSLSIVRNAGVDFHYTIAGGGPEIPILRKLAETLHLSDMVVFHPGYKGDEYISTLQHHEVYFLPSFRESTPVTLLEAYLAGCYPIVADTSAQGEIVRLAGGTAVAVQSMDNLVKGLADAIIWCAGNRDKLPGLATAASACIAEYFSSARYDSTVAKAYQTALAHGNLPTRS